jgi:hypothetical protein
MPPPPDTGFASADAQDDFLRARRRQAMSALGRRLSRTGDVEAMLPFDEVVAELGRMSEVDRGLQVVPVDAIVGTVDRGKEFDRAFRPTSSQVRHRWERIAKAMRRGEALPPISLFKVGDVYFVRDGHHRVSVARALGWRELEGFVTEVVTRVGAERGLRIADLPLKGHERLFRERVPLDAEAAAGVTLTDPWKYGELAEAVEGWAYRVSHDRGELLDRRTAARAWYEEEFVPVTKALRDAGLVGSSETDADAYARLGGVRYRIMRTMDWSEDVIEALQRDR